MISPSRHMPQYKPHKSSRFAIALFFILTLVSIYFEPWALLAIAIFVLIAVIWSLLEQPRLEKHFEELCENRRGLSICQFAREFDSHVVDTWVIRATYEQVQAAIPTKQEIPLMTSDELFTTLKLDPDDLDMDLVPQIAQRTGRSLKNIESNPYYGQVTTVRNLVLFFNAQAKVNAT